MSSLIRYANLDDSDLLGKMHSESLQASFKGIIPDCVLNDYFSVQKRKECFIRELSKGSPKTAVIFEENEPAGLISFGECRSGGNDKSWIEIWRVYLTPKFWGCGVAIELIEWGINEILKDGFINIELWVLEENIRARKFYEKMGFKHDSAVQITNMGKELKELRYIKP